MLSLLSICAGASIGAVLRWALGLLLNAAFPALPLGTLAANLIGGYLVGIAVAAFGSHAGWAPEWRLFVITGFLGGLTTFSSFSAEVTSLLQSQRFGLAGAAIAAHLGGSLLLTMLGMLTVAAIARTP